MAGRRIVYGAALAAALAFQIFYDGYLAQFLLLCVIALPLLSLALSLPGLLGLRLTLSASPAQLLRGEQGQWLAQADNRRWLPAARVALRLSFRNVLIGAQETRRMLCRGLLGGEARPFPLDTRHCGALSCRVTQARGYDLLGLFAIPLPLPACAQAAVLPPPVPEGEVPGLEQVLAQLSAWGRRGRRREDYEIRDYRPGDPVRDIHWKLSAKRDELVIRERPEGADPRLILAPELFGAPERLDLVLSRLWAASLALLERGWLHQVWWSTPQEGKQVAAVASPRQLLSCMLRILSQPAPRERPGEAPHPCPPGAVLLPITGEEGRQP